MRVLCLRCAVPILLIFLGGCAAEVGEESPPGLDSAAVAEDRRADESDGARDQRSNAIAAPSPQQEEAQSQQPQGTETAEGTAKTERPRRNWTELFGRRIAPLIQTSVERVREVQRGITEFASGAIQFSSLRQIIIISVVIAIVVLTMVVFSVILI